MSDQNYEPASSDEVYQPNDDGEAPGEIVDTDQAFGDDDVDSEIYEKGYSPPERPHGIGHFGETLAEQEQGESLDQRIEQEIPDPNLAFDDPLADTATPEGTADVDSDVDYDTVDENVVDPEDLRYSEVGEERAGRLVAPDEGLEEDREKDLIGEDVGIDSAAASAEEAAVHIIPD